MTIIRCCRKRCPSPSAPRETPAQEWECTHGPVDTGSGGTPSVQYAYDDGAVGEVAKYLRLSEVTYPNGRQVSYDYGRAGAVDDIMSRLSSIFDDANDDGDVDPGEDVYASYKYLGAGKIARENYEEAGVKLDYTLNNLDGFDRFGRVQTQMWKSPGDYGEVLDSYGYTYDRAGNRTRRNNGCDNDFHETYDYNGLDELTSSVRTDGYSVTSTQSWTLDALGNWSGFNDDGASQTRGSNEANEITSATGIATPLYDRAGNMTSTPKPGDPANSLALKYDAWNHLVEVSDGGVLVAKFCYDGTGRRIEQLNDFVDGLPTTATHYFLNSNNQVIETREGDPAAAAESLSPKYQNIWSPRYVDALILRDEYSGGVIQPSSRLFYLSDANYNVTALVGKVSGAWQVVERYVYSPFGKVTIYRPDWRYPRGFSLYDNMNLYTGRELDLATGLYYYRARYYNAALGTFVGRDPLAYKGGDEDLYRYCENKPLIKSDPMGFDSESTESEYTGQGGVSKHISKHEKQPYSYNNVIYTCYCRVKDTITHIHDYTGCNDPGIHVFGWTEIKYRWIKQSSYFTYASYDDCLQDQFDMAYDGLTKDSGTQAIMAYASAWASAKRACGKEATWTKKEATKYNAFVRECKATCAASGGESP